MVTSLSLKKIFYVLMSVCASLNAVAEGCFSGHLLEAIELNQVRKLAYGQLSGNRSLIISDRLIFGERMNLVSAKTFDLLAVPYERAGVPLLCEAFVSMTKVPPMQTKLQKPKSPFSSYRATNPKKLMQMLQSVLRDSGMDGVRNVIAREIHSAEYEHFNCMLRHGLESIARIASLASRHEKMSLERGLPSSMPISIALVKFHILGLPLLADLDRAAAGVQDQGLRIICGDVPAISF